MGLFIIILLHHFLQIHIFVRIRLILPVQQGNLKLCTKKCKLILFLLDLIVQPFNISLGICYLLIQHLHVNIGLIQIPQFFIVCLHRVPIASLSSLFIKLCKLSCLRKVTFIIADQDISLFHSISCLYVHTADLHIHIGKISFLLI